jgi:hypothetical protein
VADLLRRVGGREPRGASATRLSDAFTVVRDAVRVPPRPNCAGSRQQAVQGFKGEFTLSSHASVGCQQGLGAGERFPELAHEVTRTRIGGQLDASLIE